MGALPVSTGVMDFSHVPPRHLPFFDPVPLLPNGVAFDRFTCAQFVYASFGNHPSAKPNR